MLQPAEKLRSRIVVIRGYEEPETFLVVAQRQLEQLGIQAM
nr:type I-MYXAN CRISPR-associated protein Cas6/Cmx6 [Anabaena subtropica]